ncbi:ParB N-terminal domain-containing protein [Pseudophaeobacter sp.]|uniref:ParB/RepB/Spo0J family partition protein n=1 Tax=Pseudophaeobacter sp. TaxID=1971739 RepID=UPI003297846B
MSKRRVFDINFPADPAPKTPAVSPAPDVAKDDSTSATESRRGPMATAISENAEALKARAAAEQNIRAENDRLAHEFVRLKKLGLVVDRIPLDQISTSKLVRDRATSRDPELEELQASIRSIGLSNPIRVEEEADGSYQLIQGFRRLSAYRALYAETGSEEFAAIPAGLIAKGQDLQGLYRRMVDENLVRRDISFAEMAQLALSYAQDPETGCELVEDAVAHLYASAGRQKRSYIRHFAELLEMIGARLRFAEAIPRALGLDLKKRLAEDESLVEQLNALLQSSPRPNAEAELTVLRGFLSGSLGGKATAKQDDSDVGQVKTGVAKTTLRCAVPSGTVRCQARDGRIELAMERDFSVIDRYRLETAISAFFAALEEGEPPE